MTQKIKKASLLGATGSIGQNTLAVMDENPHLFKIVSAAANTNSEALAVIAKKYGLSRTALFSEEHAAALNNKLENCDVGHGMEGLLELVRDPEVDFLINSLVGSVGLQPTYEAVRRGIDVALANKETLVSGGNVIMKEAQKSGSRILPIDSEHSAIMQCIGNSPKKEISRLILTASGGPFRGKLPNEIKNAGVDEALAHPTWAMGKKISIDSATLMNKGFEVIEAHFLFDIDFDRIDVVVHPQSVVHSLVEFVDGSVLAHLGTPDMRIPIQYALSWPEKIPLSGERVNFSELGSLTFEKPDFDSFPCLSYAYEAGKTGGTMPAVLNAANEKAVRLFLEEKIAFGEIPEFIKSAMQKHKKSGFRQDPNIETILDIDNKIKNSENN
ncbi:MAG: 1-deoxy-D-xylulose-5-phosphate reductoisomerase [Fibrobacterota bacterium]